MSATSAGTDAPEWGWVRSLAWGALMLIAFARATIAFEPFPYWDMDPSVVYVPMTGVGPTGSLLLDVAALLAAALALFADKRRGRYATVVCVGLWSFGAAAVAMHALAGPGLSLDDLRVGSAWAASLAGGIAIWHLCRDERTARLTVALAAGFVAMLAVKGAVQVFLEHPLTVDEFERNRETILAARGWTPDSPMARGFERRLRQPEATGWFGLANVYATFAAGAFVILLGLAAAGWRASRPPRQEVSDGVAGIAAVGALVAGAALWMAGSKAGFGVAAAGACLLGFRWLVGRLVGRPGALSALLLRRPGVVGGVVAVAVVGSALAALVVQGVVGERAGDLSLLFRWFYLVGAGRIIAEHPALGVGPSGFQQAFLLAKPPLCPESVESPHSILFDYTATLGVLGLAWCALIVWWVWGSGGALVVPPTAARSGRGTPDRPPVDPAHPAGAPGSAAGIGERWRRDLRPVLWVVLLAALASAWLPTVVAAWIEGGSSGRYFRNPAATPDWALTLVLGAAAWIVLAGAAVAIARVTGAARAALAAAAVALALHAQMEMTPVQPGSGALFMLMLAAGASGQRTGAAGGERQASDRKRLAGGLAGVPFVAAAVGLGAGALPRVAHWESSLAGAANELRPIAEMWSRITRLQSDPQAAAAAGDSLEAVRRDLALALRFEGDLGRIDPGRAALIWKEVETIDYEMGEQALATFPAHHRTRAAFVNWMLGVATAARNLGHDENCRRWLERAAAEARQGTTAAPESAAAWSLLAQAHTARHWMLDLPENAAQAVEAWERAAALDPYSVAPAQRIALRLSDLGRVDEAASWAHRTLTLDDNLRLDPLMRLAPEDRRRLEAIAAPPPPTLP